MLASAAPRRSSFARSSSLARPCSSGSTTPSAGISNCHARTRTKRASSVTCTRKRNVTGVRIDLDRAVSRFHDARVKSSVKQTPFRFASTSSKRRRSFARSCMHRARVVTYRLAWNTAHRPSLRFVSNRPSTWRRGVRTQPEKMWNSNRLSLFESRTVKRIGGRVRDGLHFARDVITRRRRRRLSARRSKEVRRDALHLCVDSLAGMDEWKDRRTRRLDGMRKGETNRLDFCICIWITHERRPGNATDDDENDVK